MKVLIAIDDSEFARAAVDSVVMRPWRDGTEFLVVNVVQLLPPAFSDWHSGYVKASVEAQEMMKTRFRQVVSETVSYMKDKLAGASVEGQVLEGNIRDGIIDTAASWEADLIVMGSHGRTGLTRFLLGSVAEAVLNRAPCSVEIIRKRQPAQKVDAAVS